MLKFRENGEFKILLFGDLHETDDYKAEGRLRFKDMQKLMTAALKEYQPDLCVWLGDNCSAGVYEQKGEAAFVQMVRDMAKPITDRKIPFAVIMGNHEHDWNCDDKLPAAYSRVEGCIMRNDAPGITGNANFNELIYSSDGSKPVFNLWFIDSNNCCDDKSISNYDWVHEDQIQWYEKKAAELAELNGGKVIPAMVFQHIPVCEEYNLLRPAKLWERPVAVRGHHLKSDNWYVGGPNVSGYVGEGPCSPDYNGGQFESWKKTGDVIAAFFGHDHLNDFSGYVDGIFLAQHKTAGFRCYTDGCRSCVRCVTIYEDKPRQFKQELKHFKEFGLLCESLGPIFKRISDRQSMAFHAVAKVAGPVAGAAALTAVGKALYKSLKK